MINDTSTQSSVKDRITEALQGAFHPTDLLVVDDSRRHASHSLHPGGAGHQGETHFIVKITSESFSGKSRLARHRAVHDVLSDEIAGGVHALALQIKAPGE